MVIDHTTARAYLRRTSESLRAAVKELDAHLDFHRFFPHTPPRLTAPARSALDPVPAIRACIAQCAAPERSRRSPGEGWHPATRHAPLVPP